MATRQHRRQKRGHALGQDVMAEQPSSMLPLALAIGAIGAGLLAFTGRKQIVDVFLKTVSAGKELAFKAALPGAVAQYSSVILASARKYNVDPWVLAGIMWNESRGGDALTPKGPAGTGDFIKRGPGSLYWKYANPQTGLPPDGKGWGRGLMQVDYGVHNAWVTSNAWWEPSVIIDKGAAILRDNLDYFASKPGGPVNVEAWRLTTGKPEYGILPWKSKYPRSGPWPAQVQDVRPLSGSKLYEAAIAGYNVSRPAVLQALGLGLPAEAGTAHQRYVSSFMSLVAGWTAKFS